MAYKGLKVQHKKNHGDNNFFFLSLWGSRGHPWGPRRSRGGNRGPGEAAGALGPHINSREERANARDEREVLVGTHVRATDLRRDFCDLRRGGPGDRRFSDAGDRGPGEVPTSETHLKDALGILYSISFIIIVMMVKIFIINISTTCFIHISTIYG